MQSINPYLLAAGGHVLRRQHSSVGGGLVTVGLDFHAASYAGDGFAATGITQDISLLQPLHELSRVFLSLFGVVMCWCGAVCFLPEIGDVDEGVVKGGEDAGDAKDELACDRS